MRRPDRTCPRPWTDARHRGSAACGHLRIYLDYAPGVGTTCALLSEGRRAEHGTDVVVAHVETHGRPHTRWRRGLALPDRGTTRGWQAGCACLPPGRLLITPRRPSARPGLPIRPRRQVPLLFAHATPHPVGL